MMTRLMIASDLHLGHKNIHKFREQFTSAQEHHEYVFENLASNVQKRDNLFLLGDVAFTKEWLEKIKSVNCVKKTLILGNHDTENGIKIHDLVGVYDEIHSLYSRRNVWFSHCPIHSSGLRKKVLNIHGHYHKHKVMDGGVEDKRYINACVEHTDYKPISFANLTRGIIE